MPDADRTALIALPVVVLSGALVALAGGRGGGTVAGVPVFAVAVESRRPTKLKPAPSSLSVCWILSTRDCSNCRSAYPGSIVRKSKM